MEDLEDEVKKLSNSLPLVIGAQVLIYAIILTGLYFYMKNEIKRINQPFLAAAAELRTKIEETNHSMANSNREFQEGYEQRRRERMQLLHEQGQDFLDALELNFQRYLRKSEGYFDQLREMEGQLPGMQQRLDEVEKNQEQLRKKLDDIMPTE